MFGVFIGEHDNKIDAKGRLSIPAEFRRQLEEGDPDWKSGEKASMIIVYGDHRRNYIEIFRCVDLQKIYNSILQMPRGSKKRKDLERLYFQQAMRATVDETGRISLSPRIREKLDIKDMTKVVGSGDTFLVWKPETFINAEFEGLADEEGYDPNLDPSAYLPGTGAQV